MKAPGPGDPRPPRLAEALLRIVHADGGKHTHLGDFAELFSLKHADRGRFRARAWYWGEVFRSLPGFLANKAYWGLSLARNYAVISLRTMAANKVFSLISLAGLAIGLACFVLIAAYARLEMSYDRFHKRAERIFKTVSTLVPSGAKPSEFDDNNPDPLAALLETEFPDVKRAARIMIPRENTAVLRSGDSAFIETGLIADQKFLEIFTFPVLRGDRETVLVRPGSIVLTERTARKLFGDGDPIGRPLNYGSRRDQASLTVTGVVGDVPRNSHLKFDYLVSLASLEADEANAYMFKNWNVGNFLIYAELRDPGGKTRVEEQLAAWMARNRADQAKEGLRFYLQPLTDIHLKSNLERSDLPANEIRSIYLFLSIAVLTLVIAAVNYMNLVTARASVRAREIGIRKVAGAKRAQLLQQFLGESVFMALLSAVPAAALTYLALPSFNALAGAELKPADLVSGPFTGLVLGTTLLTGIISGTYPALVLSSLRPSRVIRDLSVSGRKGSRIRNVLVVGQFAASIVLLVCTFVVASQMRFIRNRKLGFDRDHIVIVPIREPETLAKADALKNAFLGLAEVSSVSRTSGLPTSIRSSLGNAKIVGDRGREVRIQYSFDYVDEDFLRVFGIELASGRDFRPGEKNAVLVNETLMKAAGWTEPAGKKLPFLGDPLEVVGVVRDFHFKSFHESLSPMALIREEGNGLAVRIRPGNVPRAVSALRAAFERTTKSQPWDFFFYDDNFNALYRKEQRLGKVFGTFASLAGAIACLGLLGLAAFAIERRTKEIGVRKILGASAPGLVVRLNREFLGMVLVANIIAWPPAYYAMAGWLRDFAYRIRLGPAPFLLAAAATFLVAVLAVSGLTFRAASADPVKSLRYE